MKYQLRSFVLLLFVSGVFSAVFGQKKTTKFVSHFNNFQDFTHAYQKDSALLSANELANQSPGSLNELLHDSFAQHFIKPARSDKDSVFNYELLNMLAKSSNSTVANSVKPLVMWVKAKQTTTGAEEIKQIIEELTEIHAQLPRQQTNRTERYAVLIYQIAQKYPLCTASANRMLDAVSQRLENLVKNDFYGFQTSDRNKNAQRAYFRFMFASVNYLNSQQVKVFNESAKAEAFLQTAAEYSPDESDRNRKSSYFYESIFLFDDADDDIFRKPYIDLLVKKGRQSEVTQLLVEMAKIDPHHIGTLKEYYENQKLGQEPFADYWQEILNTDQKDASPFRLELLDGTSFDLSQHKGKWILIDFWGTWCVPCVQELPVMQKFYDGIKAQNDIVLVTIACNDTESKVRDFMQKKTYSFPVVMSDKKVEKMYPVDGYPTKILITPQGKQIRIEFGTDWVSRVNTYRKY
ncbi:TlpA family protein disulfide reductase [Runella sp.]|uniref:TlpA family protein disulfide reductase n=1 Tax=Runella sp. TaxID=1960881 RepID=UPI003D0B6899